MQIDVKILLACLFTAAVSPGASADEGTKPAVDGCADFRLDVTAELRLFRAPAFPVAASDDEPTLRANELYAATLRAQSQVRFMLAPGKRTVNDGSFAGIFRFEPTRAGKIRVSLDEAAWVDVIANGVVLESTGHAGSHGCKVLRK